MSVPGARSLATLTLALAVGLPATSAAQNAARCSEIANALRGSPARSGLEQRAQEIRRDIADLQQILQRDQKAADEQATRGAVTFGVQTWMSGDELQALRAAAQNSIQSISLDRINGLKARIRQLQQEQTFVARQIFLLRDIAEKLQCPSAMPIASNRTLPISVEVLDHDTNQPLYHAVVVFVVPNGPRLSAYTNANGEADFSGSSGIPEALAQNGVTVQASLANYSAQSSFVSPDLLRGGRFLVYLQLSSPGRPANLPSIAGNWTAREVMNGPALQARINDIDANGEYWGVIYKNPQWPIHFHGKLQGATMPFVWYDPNSNGTGTLTYGDANHLSAQWRDMGSRAGQSGSWYLTR